MHVHCVYDKRTNNYGDNMQHFMCSWLFHPKQYFGIRKFHPKKVIVLPFRCIYVLLAWIYVCIQLQIGDVRFSIYGNIILNYTVFFIGQIV